MSPRMMRTIGALVAFFACLTTLAVPAQAAGSRLDMQVSMSSDLRVAVFGSLHDDRNRVIKQAPIAAMIEGRVVASTRSRGNGEFAMSFEVPADLRSGNRRLIVRYDGDGSRSSAESTVTLALGNAPAPAKPQPTQPASSEPAPDAAEDAAPTPSAPAPSASAAPTTQLQVSASDTTPASGALVHLDGQLLGPDGHAIADGEILVFDNAGEVETSYAITDAAGAFHTYYEVPAEQAEPVTLRLHFPGGEGYAPAEATVALEVHVSTPPSETPSPSPTPSDEVEQEVASTTLSEVRPTETAAPSTPATTPPGPSPWATGLLVAVGGVTAVAAAVGLTTMIRAKGQAAKLAAGPVVHDGGLDLFDAADASDFDEEPPTPRRAAG